MRCLFSDGLWLHAAAVMSPSISAVSTSAYERLVQESKNGLGVKALLHSDGNIGCWFRSCVATGITACIPFERNAGWIWPG
jgi:hypothetical protein